MTRMWLYLALSPLVSQIHNYRLFCPTGFDIIESSRLVEEEKYEWYKPEEFYPVRIGDVLKSQYQVVGKLGYGAFGTAWICWDLQFQK